MLSTSEGRQKFRSSGPVSLMSILGRNLSMGVSKMREFGQLTLTLPVSFQKRAVGRVQLVSPKYLVKMLF